MKAAFLVNKLFIKALKLSFKTEDNVLQEDKLFFLCQKWQSIIAVLEIRMTHII